MRRLTDFARPLISHTSDRARHVLCMMHGRSRIANFLSAICEILGREFEQRHAGSIWIRKLRSQQTYAYFPTIETILA